MQSIIEFFDGLEKRPDLRLAFLVGGMLLLWIIEGAIPLITMRYKKTKLRHAAVNLGFTAMHLVIHTFLAILIVKLADWTKTNRFGLTNWLNANVFLTLTLSFLTLDFFGGWLVHWVEHRMKPPPTSLCSKRRSPCASPDRASGHAIWPPQSEISN